jgi:hypothetical protein
MELRRKKRICHCYAGKCVTRPLPNDDIRRQAASSLCCAMARQICHSAFLLLRLRSKCVTGVRLLARLLPYPIAARVIAMRRSLDNAFHGNGGAYELAV